MSTAEKAGQRPWLITKVLWVNTRRANTMFYHLYFVTWTRQINKRTHHPCSGHLHRVASDHCWTCWEDTWQGSCQQHSQGQRAEALQGRAWLSSRCRDLPCSPRTGGTGQGQSLTCCYPARGEVPPICILQIRMCSASWAKFPLEIHKIHCSFTNLWKWEDMTLPLFPKKGICVREG